MLAITSQSVGLRSEFFIQRHMTRLDPANTVVAQFEIPPSESIDWKVECPVYQVRSHRFPSRLIPSNLREMLPTRLMYKDDYEGLFGFFKHHGVQVILGEYLNCTWPLIKPAKRHGIKLFAHAHGNDLSTLFRLPEWRARYADYKDCQGIIVVNQVMRDRLMSIGIPGEIIHDIPYGVDVLDEYPEKPGTDSLHWLAVGRMVGKKAPLKTLKAFQIALASQPNIHLDFVGEGPLLAEARAFVNQYSLENNVHLHGGQPHEVVSSLMEQCHAFVQHSVVDPDTGDEEGMPVAIREAMGHALPVVSTRHAGIPEAVRHGQTGFLVNEGDVDGMAMHMIELGESKELWQSMSLAAWEQAKQQFTWEKEREDLLRIFYA